MKIGPVGVEFRAVGRTDLMPIVAFRLKTLHTDVQIVVFRKSERTVWLPSCTTAYISLFQGRKLLEFSRCEHWKEVGGFFFKCWEFCSSLAERRFIPRWNWVTLFIITTIIRLSAIIRPRELLQSRAVSCHLPKSIFHSPYAVCMYRVIGIGVMLFATLGRVQLKCDGTRWRMGGEVKGKLANWVGSQYSSHYLGKWYIQHYYRWCAHFGCQ
jgi:hypothetical protein